MQEAAIFPGRHPLAVLELAAIIVRPCTRVLAGQETTIRWLPALGSCNSATFAVGEFGSCRLAFP